MFRHSADESFARLGRIYQQIEEGFPLPTRKFEPFTAQPNAVLSLGLRARHRSSHITRSSMTVSVRHFDGKFNAPMRICDLWSANSAAATPNTKNSTAAPRFW